MGWLSSFFSSDSSQRSRKSQAFSSTHDAFSLPTSSPVFNPHPDAFNPDALVSQEPLSARSPASYTYPPQGTMGYGYGPPTATFGSRPASSSLLPTHMDHLHTHLTSHQSYPPLSKTWARIRSWLNREYPELGDTLNYGILPQELAQIEMQFGFALPSVVRESYLCVDGQEAESAAGCSEGLFFGLTLLPLESVLEEWRFWREVDKDPSTGANDALRQSMQSIPPDWIRREYSQRGWIPLIADKAGNYLGVDLNPGEQGQVGQVIVFGRDFDTKVVLWNGDGPTGWAKWLAAFVEELESGEGFEIGATDASEGSEDEVGYESYFYDGHGRGQGDGGGDTGSGGGLRYTGEYRGWNVLEAWADRSLRRWHEAGVIPADIMAPVGEEIRRKQDDRQELDIVELSMQGPGAVEVAIPVLTDSSEPIPRPTVEALGHHSGQSGPSNYTSEPVPIISVTKPPAPLPVTLPTASDIAPLPSPPTSAHSSLEDLEPGRINGLHGYSEDVGLVTSTRRTGKSKSPIRRETSDATGSALPLSSTTQPLLPSTPPKTTSPPPIIPDLLADLSPELPTQPFQPLSSQMYPPGEFTKAPSELKPDTDAEPEEEAEPDTTIRLVGGGGQAGVVSQSPVPVSPVEEEAASVPVDGDVVSVASIASDVGNKKGEKKHKKSKSSIASLKRLSQLGNKKKSDSTANLSELVSP